MFEPAYHIVGWLLLAYMFNRIGNAFAVTAGAHEARTKKTNWLADLIVVIFVLAAITSLLFAASTALKV